LTQTTGHQVEHKCQLSKSTAKN